MEHTPKKKALLVLVTFSCLLLLPLASSAAPLSRSMSLANHRLPDPADVEVPLQGAERNLGEVAARMAIEVNDYPGSGANNRHEPRSPGRA
ncbi:uncharacterized protein LOC120675837 [Panicum virgatum]|uniref:Uncharacterized protein n=1 Tax=Panicum virgatum TaxID=38727 RepID=A0A8T0S1I3_PANVG|nr:uncharacterized protein LOC120675837 [Panicum virgatum]KAG2592501.1 hypothetical protein PVAP13_5NG556000 [Panicum virgatum]